AGFSVTARLPTTATPQSAKPMPSAGMPTRAMILMIGCREELPRKAGFRVLLRIKRHQPFARRRTAGRPPENKRQLSSGPSPVGSNDRELWLTTSLRRLVIVLRPLRAGRETI